MKVNLKILGLSDVHLHNYSPYASFNELGASNRLMLYLKLADDIVEIVKAREIDVIVIAGDIVHMAVVDSIVAWGAEQFLSKLSSAGIPIVMTLGQHDCSVKLDSHSYESLHSVISPLVAQKPNIHLGYKTTMFDINGWSFFVSPWSPNTVQDFQEADVFVGHGAVVGCRDVTGYEYKSGFPKDSLWNNFKLSVIGD